MKLLNVLDWCFFLAHIGLILFNLFGWIYPKMRQLHFIVVLTTLFFWVVAGFWKGFGYCPLTDWHWQVKNQMGEQNLPSSFIKYLADNLFHINSNPEVIDIITALCFIIVFIISVNLNLKSFGYNKKKWYNYFLV